VAVLRELGAHVDELEGERSLRHATEVAVGVGRLPREETARIRDAWTRRARRPQTVNEVVAIATSLGFTVERDNAR